MQPATAGAGSQLSAADRRFVDKAAEAGMAEVQAAQLAQQKSTDPKVKQFAQQMITDHTQANQKLLALAQQKGVTPPTELSARHQTEMSKLQGLDGPKFDRMYLKGQVRDHQEAVALFQKEASDGKDPQLQQFAQQTLPILQQHLDMAKSDSGNNS
jgi:putative membrane protein